MMDDGRFQGSQGSLFFSVGIVRDIVPPIINLEGGTGGCSRPLLKHCLTSLEQCFSVAK